jgi:hypothetical protein
MCNGGTRIYTGGKPHPLLYPTPKDRPQLAPTLLHLISGPLSSQLPRIGWKFMRVHENSQTFFLFQPAALILATFGFGSWNSVTFDRSWYPTAGCEVGKGPEGLRAISCALGNTSATALVISQDTLHCPTCSARELAPWASCRSGLLTLSFSRLCCKKQKLRGHQKTYP